MTTFTQAKSLNLTLFDGKPCLFHGSVKRYTSSYRCVECSKERSAACRSIEDKIKRRERERNLYHSKTSVEDWIKRNLKSVRIRAKEKNIPFNLTSDYLLSIWTGKCPVFGFDLRYMCSRDNPSDQATLDRFKPELGYTKGNVAYVSNLANRIKNNATSEQIKAVAAWIDSTTR
jgi:hypothetical protein